MKQKILFNNKPIFQGGQNVVLYSPWLMSSHLYWLKGLEAFLLHNNCKVYFLESTDEACFKSFLLENKIDYAYIWNGEYPIAKKLKKICAEMGVVYSILECAFFPQKEFFIIDTMGINATSSLMLDDLSWINDEHYTKLAQLKNSYLNGLKWTPTDFILIPLQLDYDTNITVNSSFKSMQEAIDFFDVKYRKSKIVYKTHPLDEKRNLYTSKNQIIKEGSFLEIARFAKEVVGINSTCLLESSLMGIPTKNYGRYFLSGIGDNLQKLLAALVDKQIPINTLEISYWVNKYSNPLN